MSSQQARFNEDERAFLRSFSEWITKSSTLDPPKDNPYNPASLDTWIYNLAKQQDFLIGMVSKVAAAWSNRSWELTGSRRAVEATREVFHHADDGRGWRNFVGRLALDYMRYRQGPFAELGREELPKLHRGEWVLYPVDSLYSMDVRKVHWRQPMAEYPLLYENNAWSKYDFLHFLSMPDSGNLTMGTPALFRLMQRLIMVIALDRYESGQLDDKVIRAILILRGMSREQFKEMVQKWKEDDDMDFLLLTTLLDGPQSLHADMINIDMISLSQLPETFQKDPTGRLLMILQSFALNLGYPLSQFIDIRTTGLLGQSGQEIDAKERTTAASGGHMFHLAFQEELQKKVVPRRVHFEFYDEHVDELDEVEVKAKKADYLTRMFEASRTGPNGQVETLGTVGQFQTLFVENGILPANWTPAIEDVTATDTASSTDETTNRRIIERLMDTSPSFRCIETHLKQYPQVRDDQLIQYRWGVQTRNPFDGGGREVQGERILTNSMKDYFRQKVWPV
ncbi:MAG: hypothetical protein AAF639_16755 [Chloroflexota bacterium]